MLGFAVGANAQQKKPITVTINTPSVQCDMCKNKIEGYLKYYTEITNLNKVFYIKYLNNYILNYCYYYY